ncbi:tail tape measure protein, partial [Sphingomonas sp. ABOLH]
GGLIALLGQLIGGAPGRATGGPVSPQRPYWVGERGPELFVPTSSGQVVAAQGGGAREVRVAITVNAAGGDAPRALQQSSRQVARAVRAALMEA